MEQAGTVGKRRAVPIHDRSPLDPIFGSGSKDLLNVDARERFLFNASAERPRTPNELRHVLLVKPHQ